MNTIFFDPLQFALQLLVLQEVLVEHQYTHQLLLTQQSITDFKGLPPIKMRNTRNIKDWLEGSDGDTQGGADGKWG